MDNNNRRATVCFIVDRGKVLLGRFRFSPSKEIWNGIGGWAEVGESAEDAVIREIREETFIEVKKEELKKTKVFEKGNYLHVFVTDKWSGEIKSKEPDLVELKWFEKSQLPYEKMFPGTQEWLGDVLRVLPG